MQKPLTGLRIRRNDPDTGVRAVDLSPARQSMHRKQEWGDGNMYG